MESPIINWNEIRSCKGDDAYIALADLLTLYPPSINSSGITTKTSWKIPHEILVALSGTRNREKNYKKRPIPKKRGGTRIIAKPSRELKWIQRTILRFLYSEFTVHKAAMGFVPKYNIVDNAKIHSGRKYVYCLDIKDFFPSISAKRVIGMFYKAPFNASPDVARILTNLVTFENCLPQGAPTSPYISNLLCKRMDARLYTWAYKNGYRYSRYADDITLSTNKNNISESDKLAIKKIIINEGFCINENKERIMPWYTRQQVTGLIVNEKPALPKEYKRNLSALLFNIEKDGWERQINRRHLFERWEEYEKYVKYEYSKNEILEIRKNKQQYHLLINPIKWKKPKKYQANHVVSDVDKFQQVIAGSIQFVKMVLGHDSSEFLKYQDQFARCVARREDEENYTDKLVTQLQKIDPHFIKRKSRYGDMKRIEKKLTEGNYHQYNKHPNNIIEYKWIPASYNLQDYIVECRKIAYNSVQSAKLTGMFFHVFDSDDLFGGLIHKSSNTEKNPLEIYKKCKAHYDYYRSAHLLTNSIKKLVEKYLKEYNQFINDHENANPSNDREFWESTVIPFRKHIRVGDDAEAFDLIDEIETIAKVNRETFNCEILISDICEKIYTDTHALQASLEKIIHSMAKHSLNKKIFIDIEPPQKCGNLKMQNIIIRDPGSIIRKDPVLETLFNNKLKMAVKTLRGLADWTVKARFIDNISWTINVMENEVEKSGESVDGVNHIFSFYY